MKTLYEIYTQHNRRSDEAIKQAIQRSYSLIARCDRVLRESRQARSLQDAQSGEEKRDA